MFLSRVQVWVFSLAIYIALPVLILLPLAYWHPLPLAANFVYILFAGSYIYFIYRTAAWDFVGYFFRYLFVSLYLTGAFWSLFQSHAITFEPTTALFTIAFAAVGAYFLYADINILRASVRPKDFMTLEFPFKNGKFIITDGGNGKLSRHMNYHYRAGVHQAGRTNRSMVYAVDINKLNSWGKQVKNVLNPDLRQYAIYSENIYSPTGGVVHEVVADVADNVPFSQKYPYNVGNRVVIKHGDMFVVLGHMRKGSVRVVKGQRVNPGDPLGQVGASGLAPNPHLHLQVSRCSDNKYWEAEGVPILFTGKVNPLKNRVFRV